MKISIETKDWIGFGWQRFEHMCFTLLMEEVSPLIEDYYVSGKEKGRDALYKGRYKGKSGKWIFQFKFHDPVLTDSNMSSSLFSELKTSKSRKGEIDKVKQHKPNYYVVMTTINVTSKYRDKIKDLEKKCGFEIIIWGRNKIQKLIQKHPLIYWNYFKSTEQPCFRVWSDQYAQQLDPVMSGLFNHNYKFIPSEDGINRIHNFLNSNEKALILHGSGGMGKSRLIMEFSKQPEKPYRVLFCNHSTTSLNDSYNLISYGNKYVLVMDDAHRFTNLKAFTNLNMDPRLHNDIKFIIITRTGFVDWVKKQIDADIPNPGLISTYKIARLKREDVKKYFSSVNAVVGEGTISHIITATQLVPMLIVLSRKMIEEKRFQKSELVSDENIRWRIFKSIENDLVKYVRDKVPHLLEYLDDFLITLSALSPIKLNDGIIKPLIAKSLDCKEKYIDELIDVCIANDIVIKYFDIIQIYPDILSEQILYGAFIKNDRVYRVNYVQALFDNYGKFYGKNILFNLSEVEGGVRRTDPSYNILDETLSQIEDEIIKSDNYERKNRLDIIKETFIPFYKPEWTITLVEKLINNPKNTYTPKDLLYFGFKYSIVDVLKVCTKMLVAVSRNYEFFTDTLDVLFRIWEIGKLKDPTLCNGVEDVLMEIGGYQENKPIFYNKAFSEYLLGCCKDKKYELLISKVISTLFVKSKYTTSRGSDSVFQISMGTIYIQPDATKLVRSDALGVIKILFDSKNWCVRKNLIDVIIEFLNPVDSFFGATPKKNVKISWTEEKRKALEVLEEFMETVNYYPILLYVKLKTDRLYNNTKSKVLKKTYKRMFSGIENDHEFLFYCIIMNTSPFRDINKQEYTQQKMLWEKHSIEYVKNNFRKVKSEKALVKKVVGYIKITEKEYKKNSLPYPQPGYFFELLGEHYPNLAENCFHEGLKTYREYFTYFSWLVTGIRKSNEKKYDSIKKSLFTPRNIKKRNILATILRSQNEISPKDKEYIRVLSKENDDSIKLAVSHLLYNISSKDKALFYEISPNLFEDSSLQVKSQVCSELEYNGNVCIDELSRGILNKMYDKVYLISAQEIERTSIVSFIRRYHEINPKKIIPFTEKRVRLHNKTGSREYDVFGHSVSSAMKYLGDIKGTSEYDKTLRKFREMVLKKNWVWKHYGAIAFVAVSKNQIRLSEKIIKEWCAISDKDKLLAIARVIEEFGSSEILSNMELIDVLFNSAKRLDQETFKYIQNHIYSGIHSGGSSRSPHQPSDKHERLQEMTDVIIQNGGISHTTMRFITDIRDDVQKDIERELKKDELEEIGIPARTM